MMVLLMFAAAANAPVQLARADEAQWRLFVRASLQRPAPARAPGASRLRHLEGVVRGLGADRRIPNPRLAGPAGL